MRSINALTLCFLLLTADLSAKTTDWKNLESLKTGDSIVVTLKSGDKLSGEYQSATPTSLRLAVFTSPDSGFGSFRDIERDKIRKIVRLNHPHLPDPKLLMTGGAVVGGATGVIVGSARARSDNTRPGDALVGGLAGAALGALGAAFFGLGIGVHAAVHHSTVIYEAK
jgi:hypothetical protein